MIIMAFSFTNPEAQQSGEDRFGQFRFTKCLGNVPLPGGNKHIFKCFAKALAELNQTTIFGQYFTYKVVLGSLLIATSAGSHFNPTARMPPQMYVAKTTSS